MNTNAERYKTYGAYMKDKYGEKVYKIPVNLPVTCPNRTGVAGENGCTYCSDIGAGFECHGSEVPVRNQVDENMTKIGAKYKAARFVIYFQNYSNTFMPLNQLLQAIEDAVDDRVVEVCISTRPDCISNQYLDALQDQCHKKNVELTFELGLQTVNYHTLRKINRGHTLADFIDAATRIKSRGLSLCVHMIPNLPWDTIEDVEEGARVLSVLGVDQIKLHALYVLKETEMGRQYEAGEFQMGDVEDFVDRVVAFIRLCRPDMVFQRLLGRAPEEDSLFCNWGMSWWRIKDLIDVKLEELDAFQGDQCDYMDGPALRRAGFLG